MSTRRDAKRDRDCIRCIESHDRGTGEKMISGRFKL